MWKASLLMILSASLLSACLGSTPTTDARFKDVSRPPPKTPPEVVKTIASDAPDLGRWIIYQDRACEMYGCLSSF